MFRFGIVRFEIVGEKLLNRGKQSRREIPGVHQEPIRARSQSPGLCFRSAVGSHHKNDRWIWLLFQKARDFRAVQSRHVQIREHQVRLEY